MVATGGKPATVAGITLNSFGANCDAYPHTYMTAAAALGGSQLDVAEFCGRLQRCVVLCCVAITWLCITLTCCCIAFFEFIDRGY